MPTATGDIREIVGQPVFVPLYRLFLTYGKVRVREFFYNFLFFFPLFSFLYYDLALLAKRAREEERRERISEAGSTASDATMENATTKGAEVKSPFFYFSSTCLHHLPLPLRRPPPPPHTKKKKTHLHHRSSASPSGPRSSSSFPTPS